MVTINLQTRQRQEVVDITTEVADAVRQIGISDGVCHAFVTHTTAALSTADLDPGTDLDMLDALRALIPELPFRHPHDPGHTPDHILATLVGPDVTLPVEDKRLVLGTWQRVVLFEFDGPRRRRIVVSCH